MNRDFKMVATTLFGLESVLADELKKLGAQDVLHGCFLPHFRVKLDCVPGMPTQFMFTPTYTTEEYKVMLSKKAYWQKIDPATGNPKWQDFTFELACTELCGKSHFAMQRNVVVVTQEEYDAWVESKATKSYYYTVINPEAAPKVEEIKIEEPQVLELDSLDTDSSLVDGMVELVDSAFQEVENAAH